MVSKEDVENLIENLKQRTGKSIGELSQAAGWEKEKTLSEMKSKGKYQEVFVKLKKYEKALNETTNRQQIPIDELLVRTDRYTAFLEKIIDNSLLHIGASLNLIRDKILGDEVVQGEQISSTAGHKEGPVANTPKDKNVDLKRGKQEQKGSPRKAKQ